MDRQIQELVTSYQHGNISRRHFFRRSAQLLGGVAAANALLAAAMASRPASAQDGTPAPTMAATEPAVKIVTENVKFKGGDLEAPGYLARPEDAGPFPGVVVIQEWWGVDDHIKSVVERYARQGFAALAPDLYRGQVAKEPNEAQKLAAQLTGNLKQGIADIQGAADYLAAQTFVKPKKIGVTGFCLGGQLAMRMSWEGKGLGAVVVLYGSGVQPTDDQLKAISVPMLGLYGEADGGIPVDRIKTWESKLKEFGKINEMVIYKEAPHAFFNDTRPSYREAAAKDAWVRALAWFRKYLTDEVATPVATMAATAAK